MFLKSLHQAVIYPVYIFLPSLTKYSVSLFAVRGDLEGRPVLSKKMFKRPGRASAKGPYADAGGYAEGGFDSDDESLPKAGAYAGAGLGSASAEWSIFEAEAKAPNASAGAGASLESLSAKAFARAELGSASASAGPVKARVALAADTGAHLSLTQVEGKLLGCGVSVGRKTGFSLFGTGIELELWK